MNTKMSEFQAAPHASLRRMRLTALLAPLTITGTTIVFGQAAPAGEVVQLEKFVATGSRFNDRTVTQSPVPIDVLGREELKQGGYTETSQMLQALVPSFNFPRTTIGDGTDHIRPATLRGLAPDQTLVLINGKRRHTSSLVNVNGFVGRGSVSTDFNAIPSGVIDRVEVLRDGASAQYGSDAIAGVVNIILRKDRGYGFDGTYGITDEGDGQVIDASIWGGVPFGEKGSLFVSTFYRDRENTNRSRPDTRQQYFGISTTTSLPVAANGNLSSGSVATAGNGTTAAAAPTTTFTLDPREAGVNRLNHRQGDSDSEDMGIFINAEAPIEDGMEFYAFGGYTKRDGQSAGFFRRSADDRTIRAIYPNGFLPLINSDIEDMSIGAGLTSTAGDWHWDLSSVYGSNSFDYYISNSHNVTIGAASTREVQAGSLKFDQWTTNFDLTNQFNIGLANPLKVALGGEYRWENYEIGAGQPDSYRDGGVRILDGPSAGAQGALGIQVFPGLRPSDAVDTDRTSYALYVDVENQVAEKLLLSAAVRFEDYSDFGDEVTAKVAGRFAATEQLAFRGSASTGFRAPHLAQQWFSSTATNFSGGVPFENKTFPVKDPVAGLLGASPLKPETSQNLSLGATWQQKNFAATVDFYQIKIDDRVVLSSNFTGAAVQAFLIANGQGQASGGRYFTNAVDTTTKGVDLNFRYTLGTEGYGKYVFTAGANFNETEITRFSPTPPQLAAIGVTTPLFDIEQLTRIETGQPKNTINLGVNWSREKWSINLRNVRYGEVESLASGVDGWTAARIAALTPGYSVRFADPIPGSAAGNQVVIQKFDPKWITDLDVTYRHTKNLSLSVGANNLFDIYPTKNVASTAAYQGSDNVGIFPYNGISPFGFNGAFYYTKLSWKF